MAPGSRPPLVRRLHRGLGGCPGRDPVAPSLAVALTQDPERLRADPGMAEPSSPAAWRSPGRADPAAGARGDAAGDRRAGTRRVVRGRGGRAVRRGLAALGVPIDVADMAGHRADLAYATARSVRRRRRARAPAELTGVRAARGTCGAGSSRRRPDPLGPDAGALAHVLRATARTRPSSRDADRMRVHPSTLLDDGHVGAAVDEVGGGRARAAPRAVGAPSGDTIGLVTADADGPRRGPLHDNLLRRVRLRGCSRPTRASSLQNRGACFTLEPAHPNRARWPAPGPPTRSRRSSCSGPAGSRPSPATMGGSAAAADRRAMVLLRAFRLGMIRPTPSPRHAGSSVACRRKARPPR